VSPGGIEPPTNGLKAGCYSTAKSIKNKAGV